MKSKNILVLIAIVFVISAACTGCGQALPTDLESYIKENPGVNQKIENAVKGVASEDMVVDVTYDENTIILTGTLETAYSKAIVKKLKESYATSEDIPESSIKEAIGQIEKISEIPDVKIRIIVNNGDGTKIWEKEYEE